MSLPSYHLKIKGYYLRSIYYVQLIKFSVMTLDGRNEASDNDRHEINNKYKFIMDAAIILFLKILLKYIKEGKERENGRI